MWLNEQSDVVFKKWLRETKCPMMASKADGSILWCNDACEELLGYPSVQLQSISWKEITVDAKDLKTDQELVQQLINGERSGYVIQKRYRHRDGSPINVKIHVMKWPEGEMTDFFLVTVFPLDSLDYVIAEEISQLHKLLIQINEKRTGMASVIDIFEFCGKIYTNNPIVCTVVAVFVLALLIGDSVFDKVQRIKEIFFSG